MLSRRRFVQGSTLGLLAAPLVAEGQAAGVRRIGFLVGGSELHPQSAGAFREGLRGLGYVEGQNLAIEFRFAEGRLDRFRGLASELVGLKVDVIVAPGTAAAQASRNATSTIPIVIVLAGNPVEDGLIKSFARPGGNVSGLTMSTGPEIGGKLVELLKEAVPTVARVAVLWNPLTAPHTGIVREAAAAGRTLGLTLTPVKVRQPDQIDNAFVTMARAHADGLIIPADAMFDSSRVRARIAMLATNSRLPVMSGVREMTEAGVLMSYGPSLPELFRQAAVYVDKVLRGTRPGDLPVQRPTTFELVINLKTAKALRLTIPPSLLLRADQVIDP